MTLIIDDRGKSDKNAERRAMWGEQGEG